MLARSSKIVLLTLVALSPHAGRATDDLPPALRSGYPRTGYFRTSEWTAANPNSGYTYETWEAAHALLGGIYGKVLGEESIGTELKDNAGLTKLDYFNRYKTHFPDKLVMLHFNGNARMPVFHPGSVFAGHWLYFTPVRVLSTVPAAPGETTIKVSSVAPFSLVEGRYSQNGTDVCLAPVRAGAVDWAHTEEVTVTAVDKVAGTITVQRAQYGSVPLDFAEGATLAFAHVTEGPFGAKGKKKQPLLWKYNFSLDAPRDPQGRILAEPLADELAKFFAPDGPLRLFDGLEFDATPDHQHPKGLAAQKHLQIDFKADGSGGDGMQDGISRYGLGQRRFFEELRRKMGPGKIIMADLGQRGFGVLNGVESEGFPHRGWYDFLLWSEQMNRLSYWSEHSAAPAFNYITGILESEKVASAKDPFPLVPMSAVRLQIAAAELCGAAYLPVYNPDGKSKNVVIWDELVMGQAQRTGWLGMPAGDTVYLPERLPDALGGDWFKRISSTSARIEPQGKGAVITSKGTDDTTFTLPGTPYKDDALFVTMTLRADARKGAPAEYARIVKVGCGQEVETWRKQDLELEAYAGPSSFTARFYFSKNRYELKPPGNPCDLHITVDGPEPIYVERLEVRNAPAAAYREFDNGLVLANPSDRPYTYDLESLFPGKSFTRLRGSTRQDPSVNDGQPAGKAVTVPARDALFLMRDR